MSIKDLSLKDKVDQYALMKAQVKILEAQIADLGTELKDWMSGCGIFKVSGELYSISWSQSERTMMQPLSWFRQHYGPEWIEEHSKTVEVNTLRVQAKVDEKVA